MLFRSMAHGRSMSKQTKRLTICIVSLITLVTLLISPKKYLLGDGPTLQGGVLGRKVDNTIKSLVFVWRERAYRREFRDRMGYPLLASNEQQTGVPVLVHSYLYHALEKAQARHQRQQQMNQLCPRRCLFVPLVGAWYSSTYSNMEDYSYGEHDAVVPIFFQESELEEWVFRHFGEETNGRNEEIFWRIFPTLSQYDRVQFTGLLLTLTYGGTFLGSEDTNDVPLSTSGIVLHADTANLLQVHLPQPLECAVTEWVTQILQQATTCSWKTLVEILKDSCQSGTCCNSLEWETKIDALHHIVLPTNVSIQSTIADTPSKGAPKHTKQSELEKQNCRAGWLCHRCLRMPWRGSLASCRFVCNSCYAQIIGDPPTDTRNVVINVNVNRTNNQKRGIPRIIHQTWFESLTASRYPHLTRLQNSWMAANGWEYRFYDDDTARTYIQSHFPSRFVEAYDALLPGAFKADLFRLLVLLRDGGVYSDIDVQLETDLDSFLAADIEFFVPRDCPIDRWPNSNYCLWNGLMGSTPGHPILIQAAEDVMNTVLNRLDYYDLEGSLIRNDRNASLWKLRSIPILILTGPCALGMSVNKAFRIPDPLRGFPVGWLPEAKGVLLLQTDRYDLGELRFTDIDRNILVASTNADASAQKAIPQRTNHSSATASVHYSKSESEIVGAHGVYKDNMAAMERFIMKPVLGLG